MPDSIYQAVDLTDSVAQVSPNVWLLTGFPNIVFVVGDAATLVVDTGLGDENGALVARIAARLSRGSKLFLTTTHFHPEHTAGIGGFPPETILIRAREQQAEMDELGESVLAYFRQSPRFGRATPADDSERAPDVVFDGECGIDLGGVHVRLMHLGAAHTRGDELIYVEEDRALIAGDVVQNQVVPTAASPGTTYASWLRVLEKLRALETTVVVPTHSAIGDGSLIDDEIDFISRMRDKVAALKSSGLSAELVASRLDQVLRADYPTWAANPDWPNLAALKGFAGRLYQEVD